MIAVCRVAMRARTRSRVSARTARIARVLSRARRAHSSSLRVQCHKEATEIERKRESPTPSEIGWPRWMWCVALRPGWWRRTWLFVLQTPVIVGILFGACLSLSHFFTGPVLFNHLGSEPPAHGPIVELAVQLLSWMAWSISPIALFVMGVW
jgi:predicted permease